MRRIRIQELLDSPEEIAALARMLHGGGVAAIPTESSYGLATDPRSEPGVARIQHLKGRGADKPLLVLCADPGQLERLGVEAPARVLQRLAALWPAALTAVLPLAQPIAASLGVSTLAVRVPAEARVRLLLGTLGPITATSLNRSGEDACTDPDQAERLFSEELDVLVDGGQTPGGLASTLVDATVDPPRLLRAGAFAWPPVARGDPC